MNSFKVKEDDGWISSGLEIYALLSAGGNKRNCKDEQDFASVIVCSWGEMGAVRRGVKAVTFASLPFYGK